MEPGQRQASFSKSWLLSNKAYVPCQNWKRVSQRTFRPAAAAANWQRHGWPGSYKTVTVWVIFDTFGTKTRNKDPRNGPSRSSLVQLAKKSVGL